jgi:hypothetical protein
LAELLRVLAQPTNCGGNTYTLGACRNYAWIVESAKRHGKTEFNFSEIDPYDFSRLMKHPESHWTPGADYLVRTNVAFVSQKPVMVIICDKSFRSVPLPAIWNLYLGNPAHAVGYSDGKAELISQKEFAALDLTGFVSLRGLTTNYQEIPQP